MRLADDLERITVGMELYRARITARRLIRGIKMAGLGSVSDRIRAKKDAHQRKADQWAAELDYMDKLEPELFAAGDAAVAERSADMDDLRSNMQGMRSNLGPTSGGLSKEPAVAPEQPQEPPKADEPALPKAGTIAAPAGSPEAPARVEPTFGPRR